MIQIMRRKAVALAGAAIMLAAVQAQAASEKPNILVLWGDDVGITNISAYTMGLVGYQTPNIDKIASDGIIFTDYYAEQSCTAGRSSFIMGQSVFRTGLSKVGLPGAELGLLASLGIAEVKVVSYGMLTVAGVISLVLGSLMLFKSSSPEMRLSLAVLVTTIVLVSGLFVFVAGLVFRAQVSKPRTGSSGMIGDIGVVRQALTPEGKVFDSWMGDTD